MACADCGKAGATLNSSQFYRILPGFSVSEYVFVDETGVEFRNANLNLITAQIVQFRFENALADIPYLSQVVETFTLLSDDKYVGKREEYTANIEVPLGIKELMKGALGYFNTAFRGEAAFVDQATAELRASRCMICPYNQQIVNGHTKETPTLAQSKFCTLRGSRRVTTEGALQICAICTCLNGCKVQFKKEVIAEGTTKGTMDQFERDILMLDGKVHKCWIADTSIA